MLQHKEKMLKEPFYCIINKYLCYMKKQKDIKGLLFENMGKLNPDFKYNEGVLNRSDAEYDREYQIKAEKLKSVIDELIRDYDYEVIDTLYRLFVERKPRGQEVQQNAQMVAEELLKAFAKKK